MALKIYNTLTKNKEEFKPLKDNKVGFYQCGPTVYWTQHIGNMRAMVMADIVVRTLKYLDFEVDFVRNYTDVGHLTGDNDGGEDKVEKRAEIENLSPEQIADKYISTFLVDVSKLNTLSPTFQPRATENIKEIIDMVQILLDKGFAYKTDLAIYFDVSKAKDYTRLSGQNIEENIAGAGAGNVSDEQKRNFVDFSLWFFKVGKHKNALQTWKSPWGEGFPGWHIECSAMSKKYLGDTFDIHMGGIEHIPVHHTNEIAQSEAANDAELSKYWIHNGHLTVDGGKMSKSLGNVYSITEIEEKGFNPLVLRYFFLQAHYRSGQNFTWEALESARTGLNHLYEQVVNLGDDVENVNEEFKAKFEERISDDFNTPQALAIVSELMKSDLSNPDKLATILDFDKIFGLKLNEAKNFIEKAIPINQLPQNIQDLIEERNQARLEKNYKKSDEIRDRLSELGYQIKDNESGQKIYHK